MNRLFYIVLTMALTCTFTMKGQEKLLDKMVQLPKGRMALKTALGLLEKQSSCTFAYDPTKIEDKQILTISSSNPQSLAVTLKKILPIQIKYKLTGKYIVLQKNSSGEASLLESGPKALSIREQEKIRSTGFKIQQKSEMSTPSDDLTPREIEPTTDSTVALSTFNVNSDSLSILTVNNEAYSAIEQQAMPEVIIVEKKPMKTKQAADKVDPVITVQNLTGEVQRKDTLPIAFNNSHPNAVHNTSLGNFLKKRGVLELELGANTRLANLSFHAGLYGLYGIMSYSKVENNNTRSGIGVGGQFKIWRNIGGGVEWVGNRINNSVAKKIGVSATLSQLSTEINYQIGSQFKLFIRPNIYVLKSSYTSGTTTKSLGQTSGLGGVIGISLNLPQLF